MRNGGIHKLALLALFIQVIFSATSQEKYLMEVGMNGGITYYMGDLNESGFYTKIRESFGVFLKYNPDFRNSFKVTCTKGRIAGDVMEKGTRIPNDAPQSFQSHLYDVGLTYEYNFFPFSDEFAYLGTQCFTPYITAGLGGTYAETMDGGVFSPIFPFGVGVKYKLKHRINVGCEVSFRWAFTDRLDAKGLDDPYKIHSDWIKNNDWYSFTHFFISYEFGPKRRDCNSIFNQ